MGIKLNLIDLFTEQERKDYLALQADESRRLFLQAFFKRDFYAFVYLLGYRDLGEFHKREIKKLGSYRKLETKPVRRLWLWSRGFFKTSIITEAHTLWLIVNNPDIRILVVSFSLSVALKPMGAIRNHFTSNEDFRFFFREFCPKANKDGKIEFGTSEQITVPNRTKALKEPTVMCAGVGTNITGLHFDWMKIDDLVNKDSVTNETQLQSSKDYYSLLRPIFDNPTIPREDVIGTIYHFDDLHSELRENKEFEFSFIPAHDENEVFNFPERLDKVGWMSLCSDPSLNPYDIQRQWLLRPVNPKDAKFQADWWKEYEDLPQGLSEYICVDPASTVKKKSDYTVIEKWGVDWEGKHYLLDGIRDKLTSFQRIETITSIAKHCKRLKGVKYEVLGGRHGDLENLRIKFLEERIHIVPVETKSTNASKYDRIEQRLVGQFHAGMILFPRRLEQRSEFTGKTYDFVQEYRLEYLQFPFTEHDDILDCHSQMFESPVQLGDKNKIVDTKEDAFEWWRKTAIEARTTNRKSHIFGSKNKRIGIPATVSFR